ncbi:MAG: DNA modification methylase [Rickettsiales bacterium]|nr:DNA modification methylase [Rickettsiales bacterium]
MVDVDGSHAGHDAALCSPADPTGLVEDPAFLREQLITYLGNKRALLSFIGQGLYRVKQALGKEHLDVLDLFAGSGVVARFLKQHSRRLIACDLERYSELVNRCYLANAGDLDCAELAILADELNQQAAAAPRPGPIAELYAPVDDQQVQPGERVFYTRDNAVRIDTLRALIDEHLPREQRVFLLAPLLHAASVHANTSGVFKGFYKNSESGLGQLGGNKRNALARICRPIRLQAPVLSRFSCEVQVRRGDALQLADELPMVDLAYLDPPYNQHPYGSNYFMLNLIAERRTPVGISAVSGIPRDWNRSAFNRRRHSAAAFAQLAASLRARYLLVSFNDEGFISQQQMLAILSDLGPTELLETPYNAFRGSRNLRNRSRYVRELLFVTRKG